MSSVYPIRYLGELVEVKGGKRLPKGAPYSVLPTKHPYLRVCNFVSGSIDETDLKFLSQEIHSKISRYTISSEDVYISIAGTIGLAGIIPEHLSGANLTENAAKLVIRNRKNLSKNYLSWYLNTIGQSFIDQQTKATSQPKLALFRIEEIPIPLPPIAEQKRIAAILDQAESLRTLRRQALAQLDALTQSIFLEMFGDPITNTKHFPVKQLIEIVDSSRPISYGILMPGPDQEAGIPYVRVVDMKDGGIELANIRRTTPKISNDYRRSLLKPNDLLLSIRGHVGRLALVPPTLNGANITQDTARLAIERAEPIFVCECLRTTSFQRWMKKHTKGIAVRGINLGDVKQMPIILPPISAQQEFARRAEAIEQLKATHRESLAHLDALFASLQHRAFRGEL